MIFLYEKSSVDTVDGNHFPGPAVLMRLDYGNKDSTVWEFVSENHGPEQEINHGWEIHELDGGFCV